MDNHNYITEEDSPEILKQLRELEQTVQERLEQIYGEYSFLDGFCRKRDEPEARRSADHNTQVRTILGIRRAARQAIEDVRQGKMVGMEFRAKMLENALQKASDPEMAELFLLAKDAGQEDFLKIAHEKKQEIGLSQSDEEFSQREADFRIFMQDARAKLGSVLFIWQKMRRPQRASRRLAVRARARARAYRTSRSRRAAVDSGGGDDDGQGDPDSEPPRQALHVVSKKTSNRNSFPLPWPRHGCSHVGRRSS